MNNEKLIKLPKQVEELTSQMESIANDGVIYIDDFEGSDTEKLQQAYNYAITNDYYKTIIINRTIDIDDTIYNELDQFWTYIRIVGVGGRIRINFDGFLFDSTKTGNNRHAPMFENIEFVSSNNSPCVINGDKFIRINCDNCRFANVSLVYTNSYIQTLRFLNCEIHELRRNFIEASMAYDVSISQCRFEQHTSANSSIVIKEKRAEAGISYLSLRITDTLFEGYYNATTIVLGTGYGLEINGCYFEANKDNIILDLGFGTNNIQGRISNCIFNGTRNNEKTSIKTNKVSLSKFSFDNITSNDSFLLDKKSNDSLTNGINMYAGGKIYPEEIQEIKLDGISGGKYEVKENPFIAGKLIYKIKVPNKNMRFWEDVTGTYLISINFGFGSSSYYRGQLTMLVNISNVWLDNRMTKKLTHKVLLSNAVNNSNGDETTEGLMVYWNETRSDKIAGPYEDLWVTVEIPNTTTSRKECTISAVGISKIYGYVLKN